MPIQIYVILKYRSGREVFIDMNRLAHARMTAAVFIFLFHLIKKIKLK